MSYDYHDLVRDRLHALPLSSGRRGIAAMVMVEVVRWMPGRDAPCSKSMSELAWLLNIRPGDILIALRTLESLGVISREERGQTTLIHLTPIDRVPTPEKLERQLTEAIAFHSAWKRRLRHAIDYGDSDMAVEEVGRDDHCEFGRWLRGHDLTEADKGEDYETVRQLHAQFHKVAAITLQLATNGRKVEAERCMALGGLFTEASLRMTKAINGWKRKLSP